MIAELIGRWRWGFAMATSVIITISVLVASELGHDHTHAAQRSILSVADKSRLLTDIIARLTELESGQRGYLLTQRKEYLVPLSKGREEISSLLENLARRYQSSADGEGLVLLSRLSTSFGEKMAELEWTVEKTRSGETHDAIAMLNTDHGQQKMTELRLQVQALIQHNEKRLQNLQKELLGVTNFSRLRIALISALNLALLIYIFRKLQESWRLKEEEATRLKEQQEWLDRQVRERTAQLEQLSVHMQNALEEERVRLARELHDELGSALTAAKMDIAWVRGKLPAPSNDLREKLQRTLKNIDQGIMAKRRIIEDLRPSTLSSFGLVIAARDLATENASRNDWDLQLDLPETEPDIGSDTATALYRVLQESLNNASKYAKAKIVTVRLAFSDTELTLEIQDDGVGFRPREVRANALGLIGMRQRIEARGGTCDITSAPGNGCRIRLTIPLRRASDTAPPTSADPIQPA